MLPRLLTPSRAIALLVLVPLLVGLLLAGDRTAPPADAAVVHRDGFQATVLGWSSWYGSYGIDGGAPTWCVDHGRQAPDPAHGYVPIALPVDDDTRAALAWAVSRHASADPVGSAALMLAAHDLMGATYPFGRLDLASMTTRDLAGFAGHEAHVLHTARLIRNDAWAHRSIRGPLQLRLEAPAVGPGTEGLLVATVSDRDGRGVDGIVLDVEVDGATALAPTRLLSGPDGRARLPFRAAAGPNRFAARGTAPDPELAAWGPTRAVAQRVVRPRTVEVAAAAEFEARRPTGHVTVIKRGDAEPELGAGGAIFEIHHPTRGPVQTLVTGADGRTPTAELEPGSYELVETRPPAGYEAAPPLAFDLGDGESRELEVLDHARRTDLVLDKRDGVTGEPLAGARLAVHRDADHTGGFAAEVAVIESGDEPVVIEDLLPGDYRITEVAPPDHYRGLEAPIDVTLTADEAPTVRIDNLPTTTVEFRKVPEGPPPADASLAGAEFVVERQTVEGAPSTTESGVDAGDRPGSDGKSPAAGDSRFVGRCTTDADGRCRLGDDVLVAGTSYCWAETEAPAGFELAEGGCFAAEDGELVVQEVLEPLASPPTPPSPPTPSSPPPSTPPGSSPPPDQSPPATPPRLPTTGVPVAPTTGAATGLALVGWSLSAWSRRHLPGRPRGG